MQFAVLFQRTQNGFLATVPDLPGCEASAPTLTETEILIREAVQIHLKAIYEEGAFLPSPTILTGLVEAA